MYSDGWQAARYSEEEGRSMLQTVDSAITIRLAPDNMWRGPNKPNKMWPGIEPYCFCCIWIGNFRSALDQTKETKSGDR